MQGDPVADKNNDAVRLLSSLEKFRASPSSSGFLDVLTDIADGKLVVKDDLRVELESITAQAFVFTHEDLFTFDKALWSVLPRLSIPIDWAKLNERREATSKAKVEIEPLNALHPSAASKISSEVERLASAVVDVQIEAEKRQTALLAASSNELIFFAEVNALFADEPEFGLYRQKSIEIEKLLLPLCVKSDDYKERYPTIANQLSQDHWRWMGQSLIAVYAAGLEKGSDAADEREDGTVLAEKLMCQGNLSLLHATAGRCGIDLDQELLQRLLQETPPLGDAANRDTTGKLSKMVSNAKWANGIGGYLFFYLSTICATAYTRSEAWRFFAHTWFRERDSDLSEFEMDCFAIPAVINLSSTTEKIFYRDVISNRVDDNDKFRRLLRKNGLGEIATIELCAWLLRTTRDFGFMPIYSDGRELAMTLVKKSNTYLKHQGFPQALNIAASSWDLCDEGGDSGFLLRRSAFYRSVSTLALNLSQSEWDTEHFDEATPTECYLDGARSIMRAGYPEHAVVFLAYGLLRATLLIRGHFGEVSVKQLADCLAKDLDPYYVAKYLPLIVDTIVEVSPPMSAATRLWFQSFAERYPQRSGTELTLNRTEQVENKVPILPPWFNGGTEALIDAVTRTHEALSNRLTNHDEWRQTHRRLKVDDALSEMLRQLEAQIKYFFRDVYREFNRSDEFRSAFEAVAGRNIFETSFTWHWVELFLGGLAKAKWASPRDLETLIRTAESVLSGLGELIRFLPGKKLEIANFARAREYRNNLHHNDPISPSPALPTGGRGVVIKQVVGRNTAQWIYDYVMTDFGQLYEYCAKLVAEDPPEQR
jgi:hypothetical protein